MTRLTRTEKSRLLMVEGRIGRLEEYELDRREREGDERFWKLVGVGCLALAGVFYWLGCQAGLEWADGGGA